MAANLVGSVKACYYDEGSDTCYAGAGPHDEATASALQIAGIVLLVTGTLPVSLLVRWGGTQTESDLSDRQTRFLTFLSPTSN